MAFDPDEFLKNTEPTVTDEETTQTFDPDAFLQESAGDIPQSILDLKDSLNAPKDTGDGGPSAAASFLRNATGFLKAPAAAATALINKNYMDKLYSDRGLEKPSFMELYNDAREVQEGILKEDMEHNPIASTAGKIAEVVTVSKGLGAVFKAPQTASKALQATRAIGIDATAAVTTQTIDAFERAVMGGDVAGLEALPEAVKDSLLYTTIGHGVIAGMGKGLGLAASYVRGKGEKIVDVMAAPARQEILINTMGLNSKKAIKNLEAMSVKYSDKINSPSFLDELDDFIKTSGLDDTAILKSPALAQKRAGDALKEIGQGIEDAYYAIDNAIGPMAIPMNGVWKEIERKVLQIYDATMDANGVVTAGVKANAEDAMGVLNVLKNEFYEKLADGTTQAIPKGFKDLWKMTEALNQGRFRGLTGRDGVSNAVAGVIREQLEKGLSNIPGTPKNYMKWVQETAESSTSKLTPQRDALMSRIQGITDEIEEAKAAMDSIDALGKKVNDPAPLMEKIQKLTQQKESVQSQLNAVNKGLLADMDAVPNAQKLIGEIDIAGGVQSAQEAAKRIEVLKRKYTFGKDYVDNVLKYSDVPKTESGLLGQVLKNSATSFGAGMGLFGLVTGGPITGLGLAAAQGILRTFAKDTGKYANASNLNTLGLKMQQVSKTMTRLADNLSDPTVASWATALVNVIANDDNKPEYVFEEVQAVEAKLDLYENPLERSSEEVKVRLDSIIKASKNPQIAETLVEMINNGEDLGPFMDSLSKDPTLAKLFKGGLGWDGRVYSEEDKVKLINQISVNTRIPLNVRMELTKQILQQGLIPDMSQVPTREPKQFSPRDKRRQR